MFTSGRAMEDENIINLFKEQSVILIKHRGMDYTIRTAQMSDVSQIRILVNHAYKELAERGLNYTATYQDEAITKSRMSKGETFVLSDQNEIIGTVLFSMQNYFTLRNSGYVSQLAISPKFKRCGLGSLLMSLCEDLARSRGLEAIQLDTAKSAIHLVNWYTKLGYKMVGETHWEGKTYDSYIFEKQF